MENKDLALIIPVYNEDEIIGSVLRKWSAHLSALGISFEIHIYNDGSRDNTAGVLQTLNDPYIIVHNKSNSGHGPTILQGYKDNTDKSWLFQVDSDDELDIHEFEQFWNHRNDFDFLVGYRTERNSHISRKIITFISWLSIRVFYGKGVKDANCPYRLMRVDNQFIELLSLIPPDTRTPNLIISGYFCQQKKRIFQYPVVFKPRNTGKASLVKMKLLYFSLSAFWQVLKFRANSE